MRMVSIIGVVTREYGAGECQALKCNKVDGGIPNYATPRRDALVNIPFGTAGVVGFRSGAGVVQRVFLQLAETSDWHRDGWVRSGPLLVRRNPKRELARR
jgi:hypothetical protein